MLETGKALPQAYKEIGTGGLGVTMVWIAEGGWARAGLSKGDVLIALCRLPLEIAALKQLTNTHVSGLVCCVWGRGISVDTSMSENGSRHGFEK